MVLMMLLFKRGTRGQLIKLHSIQIFWDIYVLILRQTCSLLLPI